MPDYQLDGFTGNIDVLKSSEYRRLFTQMLMKMAENGDKPTDFLIRLSERREEQLSLDGNFMIESEGYQTVFELTAVPIEQARSLLGGRQ
jgi:hypothetical protein